MSFGHLVVGRCDIAGGVANEIGSVRPLMRWKVWISWKERERLGSVNRVGRRLGEHFAARHVERLGEESEMMRDACTRVKAWATFVSAVDDPEFAAIGVMSMRQMVGSIERLVVRRAERLERERWAERSLDLRDE